MIPVSELVTGLLDTLQRHPWPFPFVQVRWAVGWLVTGFTAAGWRLQILGPRPYELSLDESHALLQHEAELPIACVEGWRRSARWTGRSDRRPR